MNNFWNKSSEELFIDLETSKNGLTSKEAKKRLIIYGFNTLRPKKRNTILNLIISQFKSPIILILLAATLMSFFLNNKIDAFIILTIVVISALLGFWQEKGATNAVAKLMSIVQINARVVRDSMIMDIPIENITPGDIVIIKAGDIIPSDGIIFESQDLFVDESLLTGETFPVEKTASISIKDKALNQRSNVVWMGTNVSSGSAKVIIVKTGRNTEFGKVTESLSLRPLETEFERGIRHFGLFLMEITLLFVVAIFSINVYLERPVLDSFLFSLALAVGLTPQLLPAIISINIAHGAKRMAKKKVIVKRLASIENFGSMNIICADKTGTLTEGKVKIQSAVNIDNVKSEKVLLYSYINSSFESGFINPIDLAIRSLENIDISAFNKLDEIPYDFIRKRISVLTSYLNNNLMITKGALSNIISVCSNVETIDGKIIDIKNKRVQIQTFFEEFSSKGFRTLGVAYKNLGKESRINKENENDMIFLGFLVLYDTPKANIKNTIENLKRLGVSLKIVTGDNHLVAANISEQIGFKNSKILTGSELNILSDNALIHRVKSVEIFAEIEPNQKERIIIALKKAGNVVGYIGDGINDASAIHAADVGISVDSAADVAKEAADIVLLEKDLSVLIDGVKEGRLTFANTLKYIFMATSANFGNMFSMAGISLILPFLPLLPKQILLTNIMTDIPEMAIATDSVDNEMINYPRRWDINAIRKFMITFSILSSLFDYLTFAVLILILKATQSEFRTAWFVQSVVSAASVVLIIRSRKPFYKSNPSKALLTSSLSIIVITFILPFTAFSSYFGFSSLSFVYFAFIALIVIAYIICAELVKHYFYKFVKI